MSSTSPQSGLYFWERLIVGAAYGKVLATVPTTVLHIPAPRLVNALQSNSEALMRLTTDFRFQLPKYQVYSFYEMKPMKMLSSLVGAN